MTFKFILPIFFLLITSTACFCQIHGVTDRSKEFEVGKIKNGTKFLASISGLPGKKDTLYTLTFQNEGSPSSNIKTISFSGEEDTLNQFYGAFQPFWKDENQNNKNYKLEFKLGGKPVTIGVLPTIGGNRVRVTTNSGSFLMTRSQVDMLFGKTK